MRCGSYALASAETVVGWSYHVTPPLHSTPLHPDTIDKIKEQVNKACIRCITFARANNCTLAMNSLCLILGVWDADCDSILRLYRSNEIHPNFKISSFPMLEKWSKCHVLSKSFLKQWKEILDERFYRADQKCPMGMIRDLQPKYLISNIRQALWQPWAMEKAKYFQICSKIWCSYF